MNQTEKLNQIVTTFLDEDLKWTKPLDSETEPSYTGRNLYPQFDTCLKKINDSKLFLRSDNSIGGRPLPVFLGGQKFYPDLSFEFASSRSVAIEVKYLSSDNYSGSLATAIGQAFLYKSLGYLYSHVIMVAKESPVTIPNGEIQELRQELKRHEINFCILS